MIQTKPLIISAVFTGCMVAGAQVTILLGPVPFVLSDFFVLLSGMVLGRKYGLVSVGLYLILGMIGLPVFAEGKGGLAHFGGPTGGYLFGFLLAGFMVGLISHAGNKTIWKDFLAGITGYAAIYSLGVIGLKIQTEMLWGEAITAGMLTFLVPMAIKVTGSVLMAQVIRRLI